ncbi:ECF transporter S component [Enterococcus asini]|uniref:ECF transporter S component n=1 Tax=Enterococcus asini TaxID=57732 RepID=UPI001E43981A|nr:ECF transporter S component [Enterococcus asini]MCD5029486.1 ECF transporter S component [Enterococcus asini]MDT2744440.1 ECF transporter S component [Enterococcus asini]MDT2763339.1 ECF transporter S component [Enterococcus asini]MDT2785488.1 ECF transporter S component [Enterococcus asini]
MKNKKTFDIVLTAFFLGIMILMSVVPFLGFIPIGPLNATILHVPVIIGSVILGPRLGAFLGTSFGVMSVINATTRPSALSFVFSPFIPIIGTSHGSWKALLVALVPRILVGIVPYYVYKFGQRFFKGKTNSIALFLAGIAGGLTNTLLVMNLIYFLFKDSYGQIIKKGADQVYGAILAVIATQGVPEAIVAGILTAAVASILLRLRKQNAMGN